MLEAGIVAEPRANAPLASLRVRVTSSLIKRPVTANVLVLSLSVNESADGLTIKVGVAACAVPVMGTVTELAPVLLKVSVAVVLPAAMGA